MEATEFMQQTKSNILHIIFLMKETIFIGTSFIKKTDPHKSAIFCVNHNISRLQRCIDSWITQGVFDGPIAVKRVQH